MTTTVSCPSCETSFPVDLAKVPQEGVRAQCSVCPEIFDVDHPNGASEAPMAQEAIADTIETADPLESGTVDLPPFETSFEGADAAPMGDDEATDGDMVPSEDYLSGDVAIDIGPIDTTESAAELVDEVVDEVVAEVVDEVVAEIVDEVVDQVVDEVVDEVVAEAAPPAPPSDEAPQSPGPIRFGRRSPEDKAKSLARSLVSDLIAYNPEKHKEALAADNLQEVFGEEIEKSLKEYQEQVEAEVLAKGSFFNDALNSILAEGRDIFTLDD